MIRTIDITATSDIQAALIRRANDQQVSRSELVLQRCFDSLPKSARRQLPARQRLALKGTRTKPQSARNDSNPVGRFKLSLPAEWLDAIDAQAAKAGVSRSAWIRQACGF